MTITATSAWKEYNGDDSTQTFAITFDFDNDSDVAVYLVDETTNDVTAQVLNTDYTISSTNVVFTTAPTSNDKVVLTLSIDYSQQTDFIAGSSLSASSLEETVDELSKQVKQLQAMVANQCMKLPINILSSTTVTDTDIGALKILRVNAAGTGLELATVNSITNGGDSWDDPVNASITLDSDSVYNLGTTSVRFLGGYFDSVYGTLATAAQPNVTSVGTLTSLTVDNITINGNDVSTSSGDLTFSPAGVCDFSNNTDHLVLPQGTTAQRDGSPDQGALRVNTTDNKLECYIGAAWVQYSSAGAPGSWSNAIDSSLTVDTDSAYDIGTNAARIANIYCDSLYGAVATAAQPNITSLGTLTSLTVDNITINGNQLSTSSGNIESSEIIDLSGGTTHILLPMGTTAQRSASEGGARYNTDDNVIEYYDGSAWQQLSGSSGGGETLLDAQTASSSSEIDLTTGIDSTYEEYEIKLSGIVAGTSGAAIDLLVSTDGGTTFKTGASDYQWGVRYLSGTAASNSDADSRINLTGLGLSSSAGHHADITIRLIKPSSSSLHTYIHWTGAVRSSSYARIDLLVGGGGYVATTAVDAIRIKMSSGTFSGDVRLSGKQKSV